MTTLRQVAEMCVLEMSASGLGPTGQPCPSCCDPDGKHRTWDDIARRWHSNDLLQELADEYATPPDDWPYGVDAICAVMLGQAAWLLAESTHERDQARWEVTGE